MSDRLETCSACGSCVCVQGRVWLSSLSAALSMSRQHLQVLNTQLACREASNVQMPELRQEHLQKALGAVRSNVAGRRIPSAIQRASHAEAVNAPGQAQQLMAMMVQSLFQHQQPPQPAQQQQNGQHQQQADGSQGELGADDSPGSSSADGEDLSNGHGFEAVSADKGSNSTDSQPGREAPEGAGVSPGKQFLSNGGLSNGQRQGVGAAGKQ